MLREKYLCETRDMRSFGIAERETRAMASAAVTEKSKAPKEKKRRSYSTLKSTTSKVTGKKKFVLSPAGLQRIERFILPADENGCRLWYGPSVDSQGRPHILLTDKAKKPTRVVRLLWEHYKGEIPSTTWVRRTCKNKACCNLDHYKTLDMVIRGKRPARPKSASAVEESDPSEQRLILWEDEPDGTAPQDSSAPEAPDFNTCSYEEANSFWKSTYYDGTLLAAQNEEFINLDRFSQQTRYFIVVFPIIHHTVSIAHRFLEMYPEEHPALAMVRAFCHLKMGPDLLCDMYRVASAVNKIMTYNDIQNNALRSTYRTMMALIRAAITAVYPAATLAESFHKCREASRGSIVAFDDVLGNHLIEVGLRFSGNPKNPYDYAARLCPVPSAQEAVFFYGPVYEELLEEDWEWINGI